MRILIIIIISNSEDKNNEEKNYLKGIFCTKNINIAEKNSKTFRNK